jgi:predicted O-methyltransferase YrrM
MYQGRGLSIRTGLNPFHFNNYRDAPFTALYRGAQLAGTGGGIALQECYFLECLLDAWSPKSIFVIGNAFGWSTLMLACLAPEACVVALDNGVEGNDARAGIDLTNALAAEHNLNARVVFGQSPRDVPECVGTHLAGAIDLCLIDGLHTDEQQIADFQAVQPFLSAHHVVLFHDVVNWNMLASMQRIAETSGCITAVLMRTPSGMAVDYSPSLQDAIGPVIEMFSQPEPALSHARQMASMRPAAPAGW